MDRGDKGEDLGGILPDNVNEVNPQTPSTFQKLESVSDIEAGLKKVTHVDRKECRVLNKIMVVFWEKLVQLGDIALIPRSVACTLARVPWV